MSRNKLTYNIEYLVRKEKSWEKEFTTYNQTGGQSSEGTCYEKTKQTLESLTGWRSWKSPETIAHSGFLTDI